MATDSFGTRRHRRSGLRIDATTAVVLALAALSAAHQSLALVVPQIGVRAASSARRGRWRGGTPSPFDPAGRKGSRGDRKKTSADPLVCYYADEWIDADAELAFRRGGSDSAVAAPPPPKKSSAPTLLHRLILNLSRTWYLLRESVRTRLERCTVYVLECEDGKYYVGSTANRGRRFREHFSRGRGSKWTKLHRPLRVLREIRRVPSRYLLGTESKVTAECMLEFGVNNVRGSMFCGTREYHLGDIDALTKFLGHYNNLNYRKVNARLSRTLPVSPQQQRKRNNYQKHMSGRCYICGQLGHRAADCPERHKKTLGP